MQKGRRRLLGTWPVLSLTLLISVLCGLSSVARADPWGTTGASYSGVLCTIDTTTVALGAWAVNGSETTFSTQDVVQTGGQYRPAPLDGPGTPMTAGQAGFSSTDLGVVAYLIQSASAGSPAVLAEVSADVATVAGDGTLQQQCLGQGGTSAARAATRLADARKFAGPYTITVSAPSTQIPGTSAAVTARVLSASGAPTPGLTVDFVVNGQTSSAPTDRAGLARTTIDVPAAKSTTITAEVQAATGLTYFATSPPSIGLGATTKASAKTVLRPVLHPRPAVSVTSDALLLDGGTLTPSAAVTGTYGYSGTGTLKLTGPVTPPSGQTCAALSVAQVGAGNPVWNSTFSFAGDGPHQAGGTPALTPGCYSLSASVVTTNSTPRETAGSGGRLITVSTLQLSESVTDEIAPPGGLSATVTGEKSGGARVTTTITARGPMPPSGDGCAGVDWSRAKTAGRSDTVDLRRVGTKLTAKLSVPAVSGLGCYTLAARSVVSQDGLSTEVQLPLGSAGTTTIIAKPALAITSLDTAGEVGKAMTGTVAVLGSFRFPGIVTVGLRQSTSTPITGCRDATFPAASEDTENDAARSTTLTTRGDGDYTFRTPIAAKNTCYTVTASVFLTDNRKVRGVAPEQSASGVFLAAVVPKTSTGTTLEKAQAGSVLRAAVTLGITGLLVLVSCVVVFVRAFTWPGRWEDLGGGWIWRTAPDTRSGPDPGPMQQRPGPRPRAGPSPG